MLHYVGKAKCIDRCILLGRGLINDNKNYDDNNDYYDDDNYTSPIPKTLGCCVKLE